MKVRRMLLRRIGSCLPIILAVSSDCYERAPLVPSDRLITIVPPGNVQVIVQQESTNDDEITLVARVVGNGVKVGAYQGELTFTPGALSLVAVVPSRADNAFFVVNPADFAAGRVRFAAYTTSDAFATTEVFRLRVKAVKPLEQAALIGRLDVVGEPTGAAVSKTRLLPSTGVYDAVTNRRIAP